eukprot:scaffold267648_cov14-Tisochrysis_lutea.AAC.1
MPTNLLPLGMLLNQYFNKSFLARFWSRVLPVILQAPSSPFYYVALWWRGFTALSSQCVSFYLVDVGEWRVVPAVWGPGKAYTLCAGTSALRA